ncbi:MAG: hypothetical protein AB1625_03065 [Acidobacteriota bacterium]
MPFKERLVAVAAAAATLATPLLAGNPAAPGAIVRQPCTVAGTLRLAPPATRGVEPSPFRYRGTITLTPAPLVRVYGLELTAGGAKCGCLSGLPKPRAGKPPAAFPWKPGAAQNLEVECSSTVKLRGVPGTARIAISAEQASGAFSPTTPLPPCSGSFTVGD